MRWTIEEKELMYPGHVACPGCGGALAMRLALKALGEKTMVVLPACCWTIIDGPFPMHSLHVPVLHTAFETAAIAAAGVKAGLDIQGKEDITIMAWAGDGGTLDIGIQALSGAAERNDDIMNTGIQRSSATPKGAWTTTTPQQTPKLEPKKNITEIMIAHRIPYVATATLAYPEDLINKYKKARSIKGTKFIHVYAPCPTGWKMAPDLMVKICRLAVESNIFPIYECENGIDYKLNIKPQKQIPIFEYLKLQGRFSHLSQKDIEQIQKTVDFEWQLLMRKMQ